MSPFMIRILFVAKILPLKLTSNQQQSTDFIEIIRSKLYLPALTPQDNVINLRNG
jgi:hypothetical protein